VPTALRTTSLASGRQKSQLHEVMLHQILRYLSR